MLRREQFGLKLLEFLFIVGIIKPPRMWLISRGEIITMGENFTMMNNFKKMDILIITKQVIRNDKVLTMEVGSENFQNGDIRVREEETPSEKEFVIKSESEASPKGSRRDGTNEVNATSIDIVGLACGMQVLSEVRFIEDPNPLCNVSSVPVVGEKNDTVPNHVILDLNNMGPRLGLEKISGSENQCAIILGAGPGSNKDAENQCLRVLEDRKGLNKSVSDHIPVLLANESVDWGSRPFKFDNAWIFRMVV
ncbi:hypothetical protein J1N35_001709 [Gossypium stocksii]|uniref:Uncharacterized protein n=1 Tax=Gossypium stocksii TaxID=47602 RepID=A0A9D3WK08_9ROSI|nr:hypothetical protein J1N35_001709 [Gossypium stocksii]